MREGGLTDNYKAVQMDFHWGHDERAGSEHAINDTYYPMEVSNIKGGGGNTFIGA